MKYLTKIVLAIILIFNVTLVSYAESNDVTPFASDVTPNYTVNIKPSGSTVTANARISCYITCDKLGYSSFKIQENRNGSWVTVASAYNQYVYDTRSFQDSLTYSNATSGAQYRAVCTFYFQTSSTSDSFTVTKVA